MVYFREVQHFRQSWLIVLLAAMVLTFVYGTFRQLVKGEPWGGRPMPDLALVLVTAGVCALAFWLWNLHLATEVRDNELWMQFKLLWPPKSIPFSKIVRAEAVTYRPILDYGGWGVRFGRKGRAYNVSGNRGVQLELADGKGLLVGSQKPEELVSALKERMRVAGSS